MNSKIDIKICTIDMLTDLQYLCRTTFYETFADSTDEEDIRKFLAETYSAEKLSAEIANSESVTFIAYKNGTPLGYLKLNIGNAQTEKCLDNALEIQRIYILKSAKGQGIGSAFMQIAENFASEKKLSTIWLGVWEHKVIKEISLDCLGNKTKRLIIRICLLLIAVIIVLQMIFDPPMNGGSIDIMAFIIIALDILLAIFARKIHELIFYIRSSKADPSEKQGVREYMFFEDGIQIISPWVKGMNQWNMFYFWGNYKNYIYIIHRSNHVLLVDLRKLSVNEINDLTNLLNRHLSFCPN